MSDFVRIYFNELLQRMEEPRRFIQVLVGPRQVGKTTMVTQCMEKLTIPFQYISADGVGSEDSLWLEQIWLNARIKLKNSGTKEFILIIDEIQKLNNWSEFIKKFYDEDTRLKIQIKLILLGSSRLLLMQGLTESLAGRFETIYIPHWSFKEMKGAFGFSLEDFIWFGAYPGAVPFIKTETRWKEYIINSLIETSISKDVLQLTRVDKPALLRKLFVIGANYSSQIVSLTKMIGQLTDAGNTTTLSHYLQLLDTAGLLTGLQNYNGNGLRQKSSSPKFQIQNMALMNALNKYSNKQVLASKNEIGQYHWGRIIESVVGTHLLNHSLSENFDLFYWRYKNDEIDFVIQKGDSVVGFEVKSGVPKNLSGLNVFKKLYPNSKALLIGYGGIDLEEFLLSDPLDFF